MAVLGVTALPIHGSNIVQKPSRRKIARLFAASLMSNSKWRKMFSMIGPLNADVKLEQAIVKLIDDEVEYVVTAPKGRWRECAWSYIDLFPWPGPTALSSIEWLEFPAVAIYERFSPNGTGRIAPIEVAQDIDRAEAVINALGKYPVERTARGLRLWGYSRHQTV